MLLCEPQRSLQSLRLQDPGSVHLWSLPELLPFRCSAPEGTVGIPVSLDDGVHGIEAVRWAACWEAQQRWLWPLVSSLLGLHNLVEIWAALLEVARMNTLSQWATLPR